MITKDIDRFLSCISNCLIFVACLHDLFIVKYRSDLHLISRWILLIVLILFYLVKFKISQPIVIFINLMMLDVRVILNEKSSQRSAAITLSA